jgi:hypothetical protein
MKSHASGYLSCKVSFDNEITTVRHNCYIVIQYTHLARCVAGNVTNLVCHVDRVWCAD